MQLREDLKHQFVEKSKKKYHQFYIKIFDLACENNSCYNCFYVFLDIPRIKLYTDCMWSFFSPRLTNLPIKPDNQSASLSPFFYRSSTLYALGFLRLTLIVQKSTLPTQKNKFLILTDFEL